MTARRSGRTVWTGYCGYSVRFSARDRRGSGSSSERNEVGEANEENEENEENEANEANEENEENERVGMSRRDRRLELRAHRMVIGMMRTGFGWGSRTWTPSIGGVPGGAWMDRTG